MCPLTGTAKINIGKMIKYLIVTMKPIKGAGWFLSHRSFLRERGTVSKSLKRVKEKETQKESESVGPQGRGRQEERGVFRSL